MNVRWFEDFLQWVHTVRSGSLQGKAFQVGSPYLLIVTEKPSGLSR